MMQYKLNFAFSIVVILFIFMSSLRAYGYAEIHYTYFGYSLITRHIPEIILDAPWRIGSGEEIPIVFIIKDADRFPIMLEGLTARYRLNDGEEKTEDIPLGSQPLHVTDHYWYKMYYIKMPYKQSGNLELTLKAEFSRNGKKMAVISDNLTGLSHSPLNILINPCELPSIDGWYYGDPHYHSDMTQDQVEFGAPVDVAVTMAKSIGLNWFAVTDHSYDLDIAIGEYFERDSKLARWSNVHESAELANSVNDSFVVIPAEELSCGNCKSRNVHLLAFDVPDFIPGSGDGVKQGLMNKNPDLTLQESIRMIQERGGFAYAAHPEAGNGFLGTLILNRGHWKSRDYKLDGYSGLQFWNGEYEPKLNKSRKVWTKLLLEGRRMYILGGNDAHGDFNRCRSVRYPSTQLKETKNHVFGKVKTYAYCGKNISATAILDAIKNGKTIITNGPVSIPQVQNDNGRIAYVGDDISGREFKLIVNSRSSEEFGQIKEINIYKGDLVTKREQLEKTFVPEESRNGSQIVYHDFTCKIERKNLCYVRLEAISLANGKKYKCFTNPIWLV